MDKNAALRKGLKESPKDVPAALAWLYRMFALVRALFTPSLPELVEFTPKDNTPPEQIPFTVVAWADSHSLAMNEIRKLWPMRKHARDSIRVHVENLRDAPRLVTVNHRQSVDPEDVDMMIADLATRYKGGPVRLSLHGPGIALRLNRKARRAALSRVRREIRRERRAEQRQIQENDRIARQDADRARRARLMAGAS